MAAAVSAFHQSGAAGFELELSGSDPRPPGCVESSSVSLLTQKNKRRTSIIYSTDSDTEAKAAHSKHANEVKQNQNVKNESMDLHPPLPILTTKRPELQLDAMALQSFPSVHPPSSGTSLNSFNAILHNSSEDGQLEHITDGDDFLNAHGLSTVPEQIPFVVSLAPK